MILGIQIIGIIFAIIMIFFTYYYYKRKEFNPYDLLLWVLVWIFFIAAVLVPQTFELILGPLGVLSPIQLFMILAVLFLVATVFFLYRKVRLGERKLEKVIRSIAIRKSNLINSANSSINNSANIPVKSSDVKRSKAKKVKAKTRK